jgi:predicted Zn-ribbon and HTH transcriptional regulator
MSNTISLPHKCPNCKTTANNERELRDFFGLRRMTKLNGDKNVRNQSWCKKCRSKSFPIKGENKTVIST